MILPLRNRHRSIWILLAVVLPIAFVGAYLIIPERPEGRILLNNQRVANPGAVITNQTITANLIGSPDQGLTLEVRLPQPLKSSFVTAYISSDDQEWPGNALLLGTLQGIGTYQFEIKEEEIRTRLILYDEIKQELIKSIEIKR